MKPGEQDDEPEDVDVIGGSICCETSAVKKALNLRVKNQQKRRPRKRQNF